MVFNPDPTKQAQEAAFSKKKTNKKKQQQKTQEYLVSSLL